MNKGTGGTAEWEEVRGDDEGDGGEEGGDNAARESDGQGLFSDSCLLLPLV